MLGSVVIYDCKSFPRFANDGFTVVLNRRTHLIWTEDNSFFCCCCWCCWLLHRECVSIKHECGTVEPGRL